MILYNMRYRGSIEYDKMILNILSFHNEVYAICEDEYKVGAYNKTVKDYIDQCDKILNHFEDINSAAFTYYKNLLIHIVKEA